ncbi:hypothetical protein [Promicromonospora kroppenstedtii]|uniref:hypothetical protein n=1 Tax=Promicromonospora kroppenstedtii TaxID=440482 RepID=UPI0004B7301A|nr:hypothetical protein [Promicromonospora kroppenstedtii]
MSRTKPRRDYGKGWDAPLPKPSPLALTPHLMTSLANAGWGELSGRAMQGVRSTLHALVHALPYGSAAGKATAYDIAGRAGLSLKWTTRCLHLLEDLGVLEWTRGGIDINNASDRKGRPGWFRIVKTRLVELVMLARPINDEKVRAYRAETLERIRSIKTRYTRTRLRNQTRGKHLPRSEHVALSGDPTPQVGGPGGAPPRSKDLPTSQAPSGAASQPSQEAPTARGDGPEVPSTLPGSQGARAALAAALLASPKADPHTRARLRAQRLL